MKALWKGALSFGLVYIPIRMYSASIPRELKFTLLHKKDHSEIRYARICKADGQEIPWEEIEKGYEYEKGDYIVLTEEDFQKANPEKTRTIEILDFTEEKQIDPIYYNTPYYLEPDKGAANAYLLLYESLKRSKTIAIGRFVFHNHEHIGVIRPYKNLLILHQLRYENELRNVKEIQLPKSASIPKTELDMALKLIQELSKPFKASNYSDAYTDELKAIIKKKAKGERVFSKKEKGKKTKKVHNILALLKESLEQQRKKPKKKKAA